MQRPLQGVRRDTCCLNCCDIIWLCFGTFGEGVLCVSGEASKIAIIFLSSFLSFLILPLLPFLKGIYCTESIYTVCTMINYKIVPVTNLNKYLHYGTSGTE